MKGIGKLNRRRGIHIAAFSAAFFIGALTSGVVSAAIPDSGGKINSCYDQSTGSVRIIDTEASGSCTGSENSLSWSANAPRTAYAKFAVGGVPMSEATLDPNFTTGIISSNASADDSGWCFKVAFTPRFGLTLANGVPSHMIIRGISTDADDSINQNCGTDYTAFTSLGVDNISSDFIFTFYN